MLRLRKYQKETVRRITKFNGRALLALDMGSGKTAISLSWIIRYDTTPAVIICPASVKWQWQNEAWEHFGLTSAICTGRQPKSEITLTPNQWDLLIINYDILEGWWEWIDENFKPQTIVIDECHYVKSHKAKRTKATKALCKNKPYVLALSGTPLTNRPVELFPTLNTLCKNKYPSFMRYTELYCNRRKTFWGWEFRGAKNLNRLHKRLKKDCMIRYRKQDILKELPDKMRSIIPLDITKRLEYLKAERNLTAWMRKISMEKARKISKAEQISKMMVLRKLAAELKMKYALEWIDNFLKETDRKIVIFVWHKSIVQQIINRYNSAVITGETPPKERPHEVNKFNKNSDCRVFCGNIKAAGSGIDGLQRSASDVAFLELPWSPADLVQAEDRLHRIGQNEKVQVRILVAQDTIEHDLLRILQRKKTILDQTLDGKSGTDMPVFDQLVRSLHERRRQ